MIAARIHPSFLFITRRPIPLKPSLTTPDCRRMVLSKIKWAPEFPQAKVSGGYAMNTENECGCRHGLSRREVLLGGLATAVTAASGVTDSLAQPAAKTVVRAIDVHAHYFPQAYFDLFNTEDRRFNSEFRMTAEGFFFKTPSQSSGPLPTKFIDLKQRLADMDAQGVTVHALSLTGPMVYWPDGKLSHELARTWNDAAVAAHQAYPDRFVVLATLPMLDPDRAIDELNRASKLPGVRGIYMGTNVDGRDLDDPLFEPIFARIEALDLPVFLHPLAPAVGGKRLQPYSFPNLVAFPFDSTVAACHLIFGGVMDRHPKLQITIPHAGGVLPNLIGRLDHGWKVIPAAKSCAQTPSAYLRRFTYDMICHSKPLMEYIISQVGVDRIMLGSDYCFEVGYDQPVQVVDELHLNSEQRKMILGGTAAKILKI
jgi:aminocarboxymuconate-semialdehyde decarboxylase